MRFITIVTIATIGIVVTMEYSCGLETNKHHFGHPPMPLVSTGLRPSVAANPLTPSACHKARHWAPDGNTWGDGFALKNARKIHGK